MKFLIALPLMLFLVGATAGFEIPLRFLEGQIRLALSNSTTRCKEDVEALIHGAKQQEIWSLKMLDATAKPETGILSGNIRQLGDYRGCLSSKAKQFTPQYCLVHIKPSRKTIRAVLDYANIALTEELVDDYLQVYWGICTPSTCDKNDIKSLIHILPLQQYVQDIIVQESNCHGDGTSEWSTGTPYTITAFATLFFIIAACTVYDMSPLREESSYLICFSLHSNVQKLIRPTNPKAELIFLNGVRCVITFWLIWSHTMVMKGRSVIRNLNDLNELRYTMAFAVTASSKYCVDTFYFLSAFLIVYVLHNNKTLKFTWVQYYLHRCIRLYPLLIAVMLLITYVLKHAGNGPLWYEMVTRPLVEKCEKRWWPVLLFMQNYVDRMNACVTHAWYISSDSQLYFICPLILIGFRRNPKLTLFGIGVTFVLLTMNSFYTSYTLQLGTIMNHFTHDFLEYVSLTHIRGTSWLLGLVFGYYVTTDTAKQPLERSQCICMWILTVAILSGLIYLEYILVFFEKNVLLSAFLNIVCGPLWVTAVAWIILACLKGQAGVVGRFLSLYWFAVIARLCYSLNLIHLPIVIAYYGSQLSSTKLTRVTCMVDFCFVLVVSLIVSLVLSLSIEFPIASLEKRIRLGPPAMQKQQEDDEQSKKDE